MEEAKAHLKEHGWAESLRSCQKKGRKMHLIASGRQSPPLRPVMKPLSSLFWTPTPRIPVVGYMGSQCDLVPHENDQREWCDTIYIPGSNKWTTWDDVPDNASELLVPFEADAGDIVVIDGRWWYTSGSNDTKDEDGAILFAYYSEPHMRLLTNWSAKLPKELQETLGQQMKELLGLSHIGYIVRGDLNYMSQKYPPSKRGTLFALDLL
ncbi:hypothetical protein N7527_011733 [Penicillium freii]|nr:hypothetical protein N7527_011733 [Penicillium freii]